MFLKKSYLPVGAIPTLQTYTGKTPAPFCRSNWADHDFRDEAENATAYEIGQRGGKRA